MVIEAGKGMVCKMGAVMNNHKDTAYLYLLLISIILALTSNKEVNASMIEISSRYK